MIDKMIHGNEFRLRILLTNKCNKKCSFCLNDFQAKGDKMAFAMDVADCIRAYGQFMKSIGEKSIVTFSGGEPGIYPLLDYVLRHAKHYCDVVKLITNGTAIFEANPLFIDRWHIGCTDKNPAVLDLRKRTDQITVQIVVTDKMSLHELVYLVKYYHDADILVKLFTDFYAKDVREIESNIQFLYDNYTKICTRFTGKQINRGAACTGCEKRCVTLKALWYFPDGSSSTCPQNVLKPYDDDCWDETIEKAYNAHLIKDKNGSCSYHADTESP